MTMNYVIPAGTTVIVARGGTTADERLTDPLEFDRLPPGRGRWVSVPTPAGGTVLALRSAVRPVTRERARIDTHGWRDDE